jgi:hypothetical protein
VENVDDVFLTQCSYYAVYQYWRCSFLAASAGIWQSDYRRVGGRAVGGRVEGNGDERTNFS